MAALPFEYTAWLRDTRLPPDDEDYEWPAVFLVLAATPEDARAWGDHVWRAEAARIGDEFLWSAVEPHVCSQPAAPPEHPCSQYRGSLPVVDEGQEPSRNAFER